MLVKEIQVKTILSPSKIYPYVINPYVGCEHNCSYCYARFMRRFTGHKEAWGQFVDIKINALELLEQEILLKKKAIVWISGVCDPYQPLEAKYHITRDCLAILAKYDWPVVIQTKSPLVTRDIDIIKKGKHFEVGLSIATADDRYRVIFEPKAPAIKTRIKALKKLHQAGIKTFVMIAPMLPGAENLPQLIGDYVDKVIIDRMNYHYADAIYKKHHLEAKMTDEYFTHTGKKLLHDFEKIKEGMTRII